ncbi:unnamed protein product [Sphagnum balticum]
MIIPHVTHKPAIKQVSTSMEATASAKMASTIRKQSAGHAPPIASPAPPHSVNNVGTASSSPKTAPAFLANPIAHSVAQMPLAISATVNIPSSIQHAFTLSMVSASNASHYVLVASDQALARAILEAALWVLVTKELVVSAATITARHACLPTGVHAQGATEGSISIIVNALIAAVIAHNAPIKHA